MAYLMSKIEMLNLDELRQKTVFNFQGKKRGYIDDMV